MRLAPLTLALLSAAKPAYRYGPLGHLQMAKMLWREVAKPGDVVIDATCGNGHDSLALAELCLTAQSGWLHCLDIQPTAISSTRSRLQSKLDEQLLQRVTFHCQSHTSLPLAALSESVALIVYNLGYLPGPKSSKKIQTHQTSTLASLQSALSLLQPGGMVSVTAYPGHEGGDAEAVEVEAFLAGLSPEDWRVYCHRPLNRSQSPRLLCAFKIDKRGRAV